MIFEGREWLCWDTPLALKEVASAPDTPEGNQLEIYAKDNGSGVSALFYKDDAGVEHDLSPTPIVSGSGVAGQVAFWSGTNVIAGDSDLTFLTDTLTATKLRVTTDLGVGTTTPDSELEVITTSGVLPRGITQTQYSGDGNGSGIQLRKARGTEAVPTAVLLDDPLGEINFFGLTSGTTFTRTALIQAKASENYSGTNQGSYIRIFLVPTGSTTLTERWHLGPAGQLGIGGATYGGSGDIFSSGGASAAPTWVTRATLNAALDHGTLGGLADDDHTQYALLAGRTGTNDFTGDIGLTGNLKLVATTSTVGQIKSGTNLLLHTYGTHNIFVGIGAGNLTLTVLNAVANTGVGFEALKGLTTGDSNLGFGYQALVACTEGVSNTALGVSALTSLTTGNFNVALGQGALQTLTTASEIVAIGQSALNVHSSGTETMAIGTKAGLANTTGGSNTFIGYQAGTTNISGAGITAIGRRCLIATTAGSNTGVGNAALFSDSSGSGNTAVGEAAGFTLTTGGTCTFLGVNADVSVNSLTNAAAIGANAVVGSSNYMMLGTSAVCIGIGAAARPTTGSGGLIFPDGTALSSMASNTAGIYADDIVGNVSMHAINENGDIIKLYQQANTVAINDLLVNNGMRASGGNSNFTTMIDLSSLTTNPHMKAATDNTDPTSGGGAATGRIPIDIGGVTKYIAYY